MKIPSKRVGPSLVDKRSQSVLNRYVLRGTVVVGMSCVGPLFNLEGVQIYLVRSMLVRMRLCAISFSLFLFAFKIVRFIDAFVRGSLKPDTNEKTESLVSFVIGREPPASHLHYVFYLVDSRDMLS